MNNLAICYKNGEGIEKNLEQAFYWFQKAAENENIKAQCNLATLYYKGEGTKKNLEKTFYWYQKIAMSDFKIVQNDLKSDEISYKIMKLFEPVTRFIIESEDKIYNKCNKCHKKRRPLKENHQICIICYQANLLYKTSGNKIIDEFVNYTQILFKNLVE